MAGSNGNDLYAAQRRWTEIEELVLRTFIQEMSRQPLGDEREWQFVAMRCARRLLESAECSLQNQLSAASYELGATSSKLIAQDSKL